MTAASLAADMLFDGAQIPKVRPQPRPRLKAHMLPMMSVDLVEYYATNLTALQRGVYMNLRTHACVHGRLPCDRRRLADIGGVTLRVFARMEAVIQPHFDLDEDGRWRHYDDEERREAALAKSQKNARSGKAGSDSRWGRRNEPDELDMPPTAQDPACMMADGMANAMTFATRVDAVFEAGAMPFAMPNASGSHGSIDRFSSSTDLEETNDRSDARDTGADSAATMPNANAVPDSDRHGDAANEAIASALRKAGGAKIPPMLLNPRDLKPIQALLDESCVLERDVVPAVANFVAGLKAPLRSFAAGPIREKAIASRDRASPVAPAGVAAPGVFVHEGVPAWRAWLLFKNVRSHVTSQDDRRKRGWHFATSWPPGWDAARLEEVEAGGGRSAGDASSTGS